MLMEEQLAAMVFTHPPYNVKIDGHATGNGAIRHREFAMASGEMTEPEFHTFLNTSLSLMVKYSAAQSVHYVCMDWRHLQILLAAGDEHYSQLLNLCIWVKNNGGMGSFYRSQHELIAVFRNGEASHRNNVELGRFGRNRTNVWQYPGVQTRSKKEGERNLLELHPTVKPTKMVADAVLDCTKQRDIVLDPFLGSGTTLLAAEKTARICYAMEIDPLYVDTAIRRWQELTKQKAVLSGANKSFDEIARKGRWPMSNSQRKSAEYEVGYKNPPMHTRFRKGASGNPKGRPKKQLSNVDLFVKVFSAPVLVRINGRMRRISGTEAAFWQLRSKVLEGDLKSLRVYLEHCERYGIGMKSNQIYPGLQQLVDAMNAGPVPRGQTNEDVNG